MIVAAAAVPVRADDCRYPRTAIEETICADKSLTWKQGELDSLYRGILRRLDQSQRDQLILDQQRWSEERGPKCANKIRSYRQSCIDEMIDARSAGLSKKFPSRAANATAGHPTGVADRKPFEGHWEHCQKWRGIDICSYHTLFQKGDRVCGVWHYYATGGYDGRLVWTVKGNVADKRYICGRVGSEVSHWCPGTPFGDSQMGWEPATGSFVVCSVGSARLLSPLDSPCAGPATRAEWDSGLRWRALDATQQALAKSEKWLQTCLDDPNYPDKADIVEPLPR